MATPQFPLYVVLLHGDSLFGVFPDAYTTVKKVRAGIERFKGETPWTRTIQWEPLTQDNAEVVLRRERYGDEWGDFIVSKVDTFGDYVDWGKTV